MTDGLATPQWGAAPALYHERLNANAVLLPDDRVLVVGCHYQGGGGRPVYTAEGYDVAGNAWTLLPAMTGGGPITPLRYYFPTREYGPPAHSRRSRRTTSRSTRPDTCSKEAARDHERRLGHPLWHSVSDHYVGPDNGHPADPAERYDALDGDGPALDRVAFNPTNESYGVTAPAKANVVPPGLYMLFVLRPKSASLSGESAIPSVAKIVWVKKP